MLQTLRSIFRLLFFVAYALLMIGHILIAAAFRGPSMARGIRLRQKWTRWFLPRVGLRMHVQGAVPEGPGMILCNHRSYLDPAVLACDTFFLPVAKAEVAGWPLIGYAVKLSGILFVKREKSESRKQVLAEIGRKIAEGYPVLVYPEGTTHAEPATIAFRPGVFNLAADTGTPIFPAVIEYRDPADYWIGDDGFLSHFMRRFGQKEIHVYVHYGPALRGKDAGLLMDEVKNWMDLELIKIRNTF